VCKKRTFPKSSRCRRRERTGDFFEQVSLKRELHIAGMLLRRGIARVSIAEALTWVKSDPFFVRPDPDGKLLTTRQVRDAENKMIQLAAEGQGKHEPLNGGKEWVIRHPLVAASEEQSKAVRHVLGSEDFVISFKGPAGAGKTELMTEAVTAIESLSSKRVMILAPSSPSVEVLRAQGFARANTLQQFELNPELQQAVKGTARSELCIKLFQFKGQRQGRSRRCCCR
jgi:hypothetical protein